MDILGVVKTFAKSSKNYVIKNSPSILTGISAVGTVTGVIFGIKATPAAMHAIEHAEGLLGRPLTWKEKAKVCWKLYIPTAGMVVLSVGSGVSANAINLKRNAKLITACGVLETTLGEYQKRVVETIGEEAEKDIRKATTEKVANEQYKTTKVLPLGDELFYLYDTKQYFRSDIHTVRQWVIKIHEEMIKGPQFYISAHQAFDLLDNPQVSCPDYFSGLGWDIDDEFGIIEEPARLDSGEAYTILYMDPPPHDNFASNNH